MKSTICYIDEAKAKLGIESDYGFAKKMGVNRAAVSNWRVKRNVIDDYAAAKIAQILDLDPMEVIAAANAEREKGEKKEFWENFYKRLGGIAASIFFAVNLIMTPTPSQAAPVLNLEGSICILCKITGIIKTSLKEMALLLIKQISRFAVPVPWVCQVSA